MILKSVVQLNKVNSTVLGQDRMIRTYTFLLRFYKLHILKRLKSGECLKMWQSKVDSLCSQFSMTRRILRWSRTAFYLQVLFGKIKAIITKNDLKFYRNSNDILFYTYLILSDVNDFIFWMCQIGLCNNVNLLLWTRDLGPKLYFIECIWWFISLNLEYQVNRQEIKKLTPQKGQKCKIRVRQTQIIQNLIKYGFDIPVSYSYVNTKLISQERAVIMGTISSFISLYQTFQQHAGGYQ